MNEVVMLHGAEPRKILQIVIGEKIPAIMSYLVGDKWHSARVLPTNLEVNRLKVELSPRKKPHPINIQNGQSVGVSLKYGYGKFIFNAAVVGFEPSPRCGCGGAVILAVPERIEIIQRRSYFRVNVPRALKVNVRMWHRRGGNGSQAGPPGHYWQGRLVDISAGGAQVAIDLLYRPVFKNNQFVRLQFTPMPYEEMLIFDAQIRSILSTVDGQGRCFGLQIVGLETGSEGQHILSRLAGVVERYHQINQTGAEQQDMEPGIPFNRG